MNLFQEYQTLAHSLPLSAQALERMADIVEIASETDEELFSAIMNLEYLMAQDAGLLSPSNIQHYVEQQAQLIETIEADLTSRPEEKSSIATTHR